MAVTARDVGVKLYRRMQERVADPRLIWGIPWGFAGLDQMTGGIQREEMSIVMARPGVGKSFFMGQVGLNVARWLLTDEGRKRFPDHVVRLVLCEMSAESFQDRMVCGLAKLQARRVRAGRLNAQQQQQYVDAVSTIAKLPIEYLDAPTGFEATERFITEGSPCAWWGVDYIGIHPSRELDPYRRVTALAQGFRRLAREVAPGLVLSQMSRACEKREDKRPMLSDLRESGALEQEASGVVGGLYREDIYVKVPDEDRLLPRPAELLVLKQRNGPIGTVPLIWVPAMPGWVDEAQLEDDLGELPE